METPSSLTPTEQIQQRVISDLQNMFGELRLNEQRTALVRELDVEILRSSFSPLRVLGLIVEKCISRTDASHGQVVLHRQGRLVVAASSEESKIGDELAMDRSLCGLAVSEGEELHVPDLSLLPEDSYVRYHDSTKSELVVLIRSANDDQVLGVIDLERDVAGDFSEAARDFARLLAGQAAIAIEHARFGAGLKMLSDISYAVAAESHTLQQTCNEVLTALLSNSDFEHGQILVREGDKFLIVASSLADDVGLRPGPDSSVCGRYLLAEGGRETLILNDIENSAYSDVYLRLLGSMKSEMIVPLFGDGGKLVGALNIESPHTHAFTQPDKSFFEPVGNFLAGVISAAAARERKKNESRMRAGTFAMSQLANAAASTLHNFGGAIGNVRSSLHELREHLTPIEVPPIREKLIPVADFIKKMIDGLAQAEQSLDDLRKRFDPKGVEYELRDIDLAAVAKNIVERSQRKYADSGIDFRFEPQLREVVRQDGQVVYSRAVCRITDKVYEVVGNLVENAVQAIEKRPQGSSDGRVTITVRLNEALDALLRVSDNGIGIPETDQQQHVFDPDYSTRKNEGVSHGMGLFLCQMYAFQFGGELNCESQPGQGSSFEINFPTVEASGEVI